MNFLKVSARTTYLQSLAKPENTDKQPSAIWLSDDTLLLKMENPDVSYYRFMYLRVGAAWGWAQRLVMPDSELKTTIQQHDLHIWMLYIQGVPAGLVEMQKAGKDVEIVYFGLAGDFIGRGLGWSFMKQSVQIAWSLQADRVWLHTCEYDHPSALSFYQKSGFEIYDERVKQELYPEDFLLEKGIVTDSHRITL